jgi:membrane associated rhomboid family serine protease
VIPIADERPMQRVPWLTLLLIATCVVVYFAVQPGRELKVGDGSFTESASYEDLRFDVDNAAIPCELVKGRPLTENEFRRTFSPDIGDTSACTDGGGPAHSPGKVVLLGVLVTMFLHRSITHLFGNMLFLWVFGATLEAERGWRRYLLLYLVGGVLATAAHVAVDPNSTVPVVGASGAIAAVMGAYFVLWPSARLKTIIWFGPFLLRKVKAFWLLLIWFASQFLILASGDSGTAWAAHVGGFAFGVLIGLLWRASAARAPQVPTALPPATTVAA